MKWPMELGAALAAVFWRPSLGLGARRVARPCNPEAAAVSVTGI
jgi:hypothetical protein